MASLQILTALTALSSPVKPSDAKVLSGNMSALGNLGVADLKAISIVSLIIQLNGFAGTNYTAAHGQLIQDAQSFMGPFSRIVREETRIMTQMQTALEWGAAKAKVGGTSTDVAALLATGRDFRVMPLETLNKIQFFLRYKLALLTV